MTDFAANMFWLNAESAAARAREHAKNAVEATLAEVERHQRNYDEAYTQLWLAAERVWRAQVDAAAARIGLDATASYLSEIAT